MNINNKGTSILSYFILMIIIVVILVGVMAIAIPTLQLTIGHIIVGVGVALGVLFVAIIHNA
jgi:hypothetical protein